MDATDPAVDQIAEADGYLAEFQQRYDELAERWRQWGDHRAALAAHLASTRRVPMPAAPMPETAAATPSAAAPMPAAPTSAAPAPAAQVPQPDAWAAQARPRPERHTPKILTAPVLLGVSGAALMIAAAVVFVAVTWETFLPFAQGLIVLAIAVAVAQLSLWLKRLTLVITSGAVGVVAMSFAGVSVIAFDRESQALGDYTTPVALLVTCAAGLVLARLGITWVSTGAALALVGAAIGFTTVATVHAAADPERVFAIVGALSAAVNPWVPIWKAPVKVKLRKLLPFIFRTMSPAAATRRCETRPSITNSPLSRTTS